FGQTEIQNLGLIAFRDEYVCRLNVAVDDSLRMRRVQAIDDLNRQVQQLIQFYLVSFQAMFERLSFQQFHNDEREWALRSTFAHKHARIDIMDRTDVRMVQRGG